MSALDRLQAQQQPKRLTEEQITRLAIDYALRVLQYGQENRVPDDPKTVHESWVISAWKAGASYMIDHGYIGGLSVDEVMEAMVEVRGYIMPPVMRQRIRARLTDKMNNG